MSSYFLDTKDIKVFSKKLKAGDIVYLSGVVYTSRDAAHKRIFDLIENNKQLPYDIDSATQYFAGPTPTPKNLPIGSCGPTTASRMDKFSPKLLEMGLSAMIGKGPRNDTVIQAIIRNNAVYFCAVGGAGAIAAECIKSCEIIAFEDLGTESIKKLIFKNFPLIVAIDCYGGNLFRKD
ncbi:MAG: FumA C-terminus/TtdB family hydratase beta subunit [Candidatus Fimenecus sp.]